MRLISLFITIFIFTGFVHVEQANAQVDADLEELYDSLEGSDESEVEEVQKASETKKTIVTKEDRRQLKRVSELGSLEHFKDIAVISKKYMPKTGRFEASLQGTLTTNNAFYDNFGGAVKLGYYFTEKYGIEVAYASLSDSERQTTKSLRNDANIETRSFVSPENYVGVNFKWAPMYGKMALFEDKIVSFDLYFTLGAGMTTTGVEDEVSISIGAGQLYSITKSWAVRWDANVNFYEATVLENPSNPTLSAVSETSHFDILLSVGVSYFFPGVN